MKNDECLNNLSLFSLKKETKHENGEFSNKATMEACQLPLPLPLTKQVNFQRVAVSWRH